MSGFSYNTTPLSLYPALPYICKPTLSFSPNFSLYIENWLINYVIQTPKILWGFVSRAME